MNTYAILDDSRTTVVNVAVTDDASFAADQGWVDISTLDPMPGIGWTHSDGHWTAPPSPPPAG